MQEWEQAPKQTQIKKVQGDNNLSAKLLQDLSYKLPKNIHRLFCTILYAICPVKVIKVYYFDVEYIYGFV